MTIYKWKELKNYTLIYQKKNIFLLYIYKKKLLKMAISAQKYTKIIGKIHSNLNSYEKADNIQILNFHSDLYSITFHFIII